jgi:hypothetical protein
MIATGLGDDGDDLPVIPARRGVPPFPWGSLRFILTSGGDYSADTSAKPAPVQLHRGEWDGIRKATIERASYGPVREAISRAFGESRVIHGLHATHWKVFIACEVGMVERPNARGVMIWRVYRPEDPDAVMPDEEAARTFGIALSSVRTYHSQARTAIEKEWRNIHAHWDAPGDLDT